MNRWNAPLISGRVLGPSRGMALREELQGAERQAWQEAEAAGRAAGMAAGQQLYEAKLGQAEKLCASLNAALSALARPLATIDDEVHVQIVELAVMIARGVIRRELKTDPTQIIGIVRETVSLLPASSRGVRVVLHPDDASLVRERLPTAGPDQVWTINEDPVLARGDCRVHTEYAQIDARVETRLNESIAVLLGEERAQARGGVAS